MQLCASWPTVDASAPCARPKPCTQPSPMRPVCRCRSTTARRATPLRGSEGSVTRDEVVSDPSWMPMVRTRAPATTASPKAAAGGGESKVHGTAHEVRGRGVDHRARHDGTVAGHQPAALVDPRGAEARERVEAEDVGLVARPERAELGEAVVLGRIERGQDQGVDLAHPGLDGQLDAVVEMSRPRAACRARGRRCRARRGRCRGPAPWG